jgi:hypothetical protein
MSRLRQTGLADQTRDDCDCRTIEFYQSRNLTANFSAFISTYTDWIDLALIALATPTAFCVSALR